VNELPIIDVAPLVDGGVGAVRVARQIADACRDTGFFYVVGHGVDRALALRLEAASRGFFALELAEKLRIRMDLGGRAWRGYFPVGGELTSGIPDDKEGLYFGAELSTDDPRVVAGTPLHGCNLFPPRPDLGGPVLAWLDEMTRLIDTRFVIITHNPITMARMNRLFGVTMAERGVSQLVSVDLEGAVKIRDQAVA